MKQATIIIPTYNYAQYIIEAIDSVLAQVDTTHVADIEIIVVDDGSTDNTQAVLKNYIDTGKIRYFYQKNQGKAAATRKAIESAKGKYIFNLDADDFFLPNKLKRFIAAFEQYPSVIHIGSAAKIVDAEGKPISVEVIAPEWADRPVKGIDLATYFLKNNTLWAGGTTYAARTEVLKTLVIPDNVDMYLDEYLILGILSRGDSYCFTDPLSIWRVHGNNYSNTTAQQVKEKNKRSLKSSAGALDALRNFSGLPEYLLKIYAFKHQTRVIASLEDSNEKSLTAIGRYAQQMLMLRGEGAGFFRRYTSFNRLLPTKMLHFLKKIASSPAS